MREEIKWPSAGLRGFTLLELLSVVGVIALLVALLLPAMSQGRAQARRVRCIVQLQQMGVSFHLYAHDNRDRFPAPHSTNASSLLEHWPGGDSSQPGAAQIFQALAGELATPRILVCPSDSRRKPASDFSSLRDENLSYFANPDAVLGRSDSVLAGDRNLSVAAATERGAVAHKVDRPLSWSAELHRYQGNLLFADGRVERWSNRQLAAVKARDITLTENLVSPVLSKRSPADTFRLEIPPDMAPAFKSTFWGVPLGATQTAAARAVMHGPLGITLLRPLSPVAARSVPAPETPDRLNHDFQVRFWLLEMLALLGNLAAWLILLLLLLLFMVWALSRLCHPPVSRRAA